MIKIGGIEVKQNRFPDNTLLAKFDPNTEEFKYDRGAIVIEWLYEGDHELFTLICLKRHLERHFSNLEIVLDMPYIPHARMDRVKNDEDIFTLKYFCEVINSLNFKVVWVRDAHSYVSLALLNNVEDTGVKNYVNKATELSKAAALFFPDEGATKRYSNLTDKPYAFGIKKRDWQTGKILGLELMNKEVANGKDILIIDDICSRGGTFFYAAKALKEAGANKIYLYVTHCENTILEGELLTSGLIEKVYTTNSIFTKEHEKIEVFEL